MQTATSEIGFADCYFYHSIDLPGHGLVPGPWDLRGTEADYLGHVDLAGRSVLEFGPASGGITAYMERSGAEVTCLEGSEEYPVDILPDHKVDVPAHRAAGAIVLKRFCNAWHYTKAALDLRATVRYGDIYAIAEPPGSYDVALLGAILLHLRSPLDAISRACAAARDAVIVTDLLTPGLESETGSLVSFNPTQGQNLMTWWLLSPGAVLNMLALHGFTDCTVTHHQQMHYPLGDFAAGLQPTPMFTVVARRPA